MLLKFLPIVCAIFAFVKGNCGPFCPIPKHYEELGCRGDYVPGEMSCCSSRYVCPDLTTLDSEFCQVNGNTYQKGETVSKEDSTPCTKECVCAESGDGGLKFVCPIIDSPEGLVAAEKDCVYKYSLDQCGPVDKVCGAASKTLPQCHFNGKTYDYGQKFTPDTLYAPCHQCICDENFDNSSVIAFQLENKSCKKVNCGLQIRFMDEFKKGCTPIYYKDTKCCPIGFRCPSASDTILPREGLPDISTVKTEALCKFGTLTLQRYQSIASDDKCIECTCRTPPMIDCIRKENCQN